MQLESIEPRNNVGHSIFQVRKGQTVESTPLNDRVFINDSNPPWSAPILLFLEPQLSRIHPEGGTRYGGKSQFILPFGFGKAGRDLVDLQYEFYRSAYTPSLEQSR